MYASQAELEQALRLQGKDRARNLIQRNEREGRADANQYAQPLYRRFVLPLKEIVEREVRDGVGKAGRRAAHVSLIAPLDSMASAFIAVRTALVSLSSSERVDEMTARVLASTIGNSLYRELVLSVFEDIEPNLFYEVTQDLDRRHSRSQRHRYAALMGAARNKGTTLPKWGQADREQLGMFFVEALRELGMIEVIKQRVTKSLGGGRAKHKEVLLVMFTEQTEKLMDNVRGLVELTMPMHLPFIEQPADWVAMDNGGYHTNAMRCMMPHCVSIRRVKNVDVLKELREADLGKVLKAINKLQAVKWQINTEMLDTVRLVARHFDMDEIIAQGENPRPHRPEWLDTLKNKAQMSAEQLSEFTHWKREMAEWYTQNKLRFTKSGRFASATKVADEFKDYDAIYFLYQADFRGRLYAQTTGVSPQGSDLQKALLRFSVGKPLLDDDAVLWFKAAGASRFGIDKVDFSERLAWVDAHDADIRGWADDPIANDGWTEADSPLQFLAWAKEYAEWRRTGRDFLSRLAVGLDGSCNGLQHFSAMLRDPVGGAAVNLRPTLRPNDIYQQVANVVTRKLPLARERGERDARLKSLWLSHGINRTVVKRSVMTLPYGSTRYSAADFIEQDYLKAGKAPEFAKNEYGVASTLLSYVVWDSIGEVVIKATEAMSWLQNAAKAIIDRGESQIRWVSPSGFPVVQTYNEIEEIQVRTRLFGGSRIKVHQEIDSPHVNHHKNGLSPNFVHSMDAAHLALTVVGADELGIDSLAMVHDDYGTHAADTQKLFMLIRETFVCMYEENDPLADFRSRYEFLPPVPERGELDIREVLRSPYFFH